MTTAGATVCASWSMFERAPQVEPARASTGRQSKRYALPRNKTAMLPRGIKLVLHGEAGGERRLVADRIWAGEPAPGEEAAALLAEARKRLR